MENAYEGVKKIYVAEILAMIATVLLLIGSVISALGLNAGENTASGENLLIRGGLIVVIAAVLMIVAAIINIIGVNRAAKDESAFKNALIVLIAGIAVNAIVSFFSNNSTISSIGKTLTTVTEILASYFICTGVINLADRLHNSEVSARGTKVRSILMGVWAASAVLNILATILGSNETMQTVIAIITIVGGVVSIVAYCFYIGLLGRAKNMLAK